MAQATVLLPTSCTELQKFQEIFLKGPVSLIDPSQLLRPEATFNDKPIDAFRDYTIDDNDPIKERVRRTYYNMHTNVTVDLVKQKREKWLKFNHFKSTIKEALIKLNDLVDESDPDTDLPNIVHAFQTAERIRADHPDEDWFHLTGLIHDLGKVMAFYDEPQWCVVGDTFVVGCKWADSIVYGPESFKDNPDTYNPKYNTKYGMYTPHCGLDNLLVSWSHDEYMYQFLKHNKAKIPEKGLYMIRYHSLYPWHAGGDYRHLTNEKDEKILEWVLEFNKYDLYTKSEHVPDIEALWPYYEALIDKYIPGVCEWTPAIYILDTKCRRNQFREFLREEMTKSVQESVVVSRFSAELLIDRIKMKVKPESPVSMLDPSLLLRPEGKFDDKPIDAFRDYSIDENDPIKERVRKTYYTMHENMTVDFVKGKMEKWLKFNHFKATVKDALIKLNDLVDESDPDTDLPNIVHAFQTAERIRADHPDEDWMQLIGLIHDLGKVMAFYNEPQWCVVGDTFAVGCKWGKSIVYGDDSFKNNPDTYNSKYNTAYGMYKPNCGLENLLMSWGHDEYLYRVLVHNKAKFPKEGLWMIRYHSFYPWHAGGDYKHLLKESDKEIEKAVLEFNQYDLYTKSSAIPDVEALWPYYEKLIEKYIPGVIEF